MSVVRDRDRKLTVTHQLQNVIFIIYMYSVVYSVLYSVQVMLHLVLAFYYLEQTKVIMVLIIDQDSLEAGLRFSFFFLLVVVDRHACPPQVFSVTHM